MLVQLNEAGVYFFKIFYCTLVTKEHLNHQCVFQSLKGLSLIHVFVNCRCNVKNDQNYLSENEQQTLKNKSKNSF